MLKNNISLVTARSNKSGSIDHFFTANFPSDVKYGERSTGSTFSPLYISPSESDALVRPNLSNDFSQGLTAHTGIDYKCKVDAKQKDTGRGDMIQTFGPRNVFDYIYAILHSPNYRARYADFLKSDFPRIPLPAGAGVFRELVLLGRNLTALHLLDVDQTPALEKPETRFVRSGEARVEKGYPKYENGKVMINSSCFFEDITPDVWEFHIGGYQVCHKWLKGRAGKGGKNPHPGRILSDDDILHYRRITVALRETISLMKQVDAVINTHGGWPDAFYQAPPPPPTIEEIIGAEESHDLEFKSTFQWNVRKDKKDTALQKSCLKTIAAFLNTKGGTLAIGVTDDKEIYGLDKDLELTRGTTDMFEQTLRSIIGNTIGLDFANYCSVRFSDAGGKQVCIVEVEKSAEPVFMKFQGKEDFFIRDGNATKSLSAKDQHNYIRKRFS